MKITLTFLALVLACHTMLAQKPHLKFGKPLMDELTMEHYPADTAASAVVLVDYGKSRFNYNKSINAFQIQFERYTRIKIFNPEAYKRADVSVAVYKSTGGKETVSSIKGNTYNLVNGKIETTKLSKSSRFKEELSDRWTLEKFTLPEVKEGSVIEYTYTITSDFIFQLRDWQFQATIPTLWSEYQVTIPEYFDYKQLSQGHIPFDIKEQDASGGSINFLSTNRSTNGVTRSTVASRTVEFENHIFRWAAKNVPAFKTERYLTCVDDHISKIEFELSTIRYPGNPIEQVMDTWGTLEKKLKEHERFGLAVKRAGYYKDELAILQSATDGEMETMQQIYDFIQQRMEWNGNRSKYVSVSLKKAFEERKGNSGDINLLLVSMLRSAGLQANPVILSTRDNGKIIEYYPIISRFNYVIAEVIVDGKSYLLDATDKHCPINTLPYRCLNKQGRRIADNSGWVNLVSKNKQITMTQVTLNLGADGNLEGSLVEKQKGYNAASKRGKILKEGQDEYVIEKFKDQSGWNVDSYEFKNLEAKDQSLVSTYEVSIEESAESLGDLIYLNAIFSEDLKENPFKTENRLYPVDFGSQSAQTYIANIKIPDGYSVDEIPTGMALSLPNAAGSFRFNVAQTGNTIQLMSNININQVEFNSHEYPNLREFYNRIVDKHNEQIVLKKL